MLPSDWNRLGHESRIKALRTSQRPFKVILGPYHQPSGDRGLQALWRLIKGSSTGPSIPRDRAISVLWRVIAMVLGTALVLYSVPYLVMWWFKL
jgi:hypothetical protein